MSNSINKITDLIFNSNQNVSSSDLSGVDSLNRDEVLELINSLRSSLNGGSTMFGGNSGAGRAENELGLESNNVFNRQNIMEFNREQRGGSNGAQNYAASATYQLFTENSNRLERQSILAERGPGALNYAASATYQLFTENSNRADRESILAERGPGAQNYASSATARLYTQNENRRNRSEILSTQGNQGVSGAASATENLRNRQANVEYRAANYIPPYAR